MSPALLDWLMADPIRIVVGGAIAYAAVLLVWLIQGWRISRKN